MLLSHPTVGEPLGFSWGRLTVIWDGTVTWGFCQPHAPQPQRRWGSSAGCRLRLCWTICVLLYLMTSGVLHKHELWWWFCISPGVQLPQGDRIPPQPHVKASADILPAPPARGTDQPVPGPVGSSGNDAGPIAAGAGVLFLPGPGPPGLAGWLQVCTLPLCPAGNHHHTVHVLQRVDADTFPQTKAQPR